MSSEKLSSTNNQSVGKMLTKAASRFILGSSKNEHLFSYWSPTAENNEPNSSQVEKNSPDKKEVLYFLN